MLTSKRTGHRALASAEVGASCLRCTTHSRGLRVCSRLYILDSRDGTLPCVCMAGSNIHLNIQMTQCHVLLQHAFPVSATLRVASCGGIWTIIVLSLLQCVHVLPILVDSPRRPLLRLRSAKKLRMQGSFWIVARSNERFQVPQNVR